MPEDRWDLPHHRAQTVSFGTEFGIEPIVVRLFRFKEALDQRPVARQKSLRVGMTRVTPMRQEPIAGRGALPEKSAVLQACPIIRGKVGVKLSPAFGAALQQRRAHQGIRPSLRAYS